MLIITGEWLYAKHQQKQLLTSVTPAETTAPAEKTPAMELNRKAEASYVDLVSRPLFLKGRRPVNEPISEEAQASATSNSFDWKLDGVYSTKKGLSALFSRSKSKIARENHRRIGVGVDLDGWKLAEVHLDRVVLNQGGRQKELLLRKPKAKEARKDPNTGNNPGSPDNSNNPDNPNNPHNPNNLNAPTTPQPEVDNLENSDNENF
jgi:hypothetical protein